jgi:hypothetical protein
MDDASLHHRFGEDRIDGIGKALQAIDDGNQNILDTPVLELDTRKNPGALTIWMIHWP